LATALTFLLVLLPGNANQSDPADNLFKAGKFAEAEKAYAQIAARDPASLASQAKVRSWTSWRNLRCW
jgi:hypothetical protein